MAILLELQLPSFDTILHNYKFSYSMQISCSSNAAVKYSIQSNPIHFISGTAFIIITYLLWTFSVWNKTWLIDWLLICHSFLFHVCVFVLFFYIIFYALSVVLHCLLWRKNFIIFWTNFFSKLCIAFYISFITVLFAIFTAGWSLFLYFL